MLPDFIQYLFPVTPRTSEQRVPGRFVFVDCLTLFTGVKMNYSKYAASK
jgi:hypothetical protein